MAFCFDDAPMTIFAKIKRYKAFNEQIAIAPLICENARIDVKDSLRKKAIVRLISPRI